MRGLSVMLKRVGLLVVRMRREGDPVVDYLEGICRGKRVTIVREERSVEPESFFRKSPDYPVVIWFTGEGIITKLFDETGGGMERITVGGEFLWERESFSGDGMKIVFTRKERIEALSAVLEKQKVPVAGIHLSPSVDEREYESYLFRFFQEELKWKVLMEPTERGSCLCTLLRRKLRLPVLVCLLSLLLVNFLWNDTLRKRHSLLQAELTRVERNVSARDKHSREVERVVNEYRRTGNRRNAFIVDRMAAVIPPEVVLESLEIGPLLKVYEKGKPLSIRDGLLRCKGRCAITEKITRFIGELTKTDFAREVKLISLERERDTGQSLFKIEIRL